MAACVEVAYREGDQMEVEELEPTQDMRARGEHEVDPGAYERVGEATLVAAILAEVVLGPVRDVLIGSALGAGVEHRDDEVRSSRRPVDELPGGGDVEQALCPRIRREAEDRDAQALCSDDRDLPRAPAPAEPVGGERGESLPLARGAVVEGVVVRDVEIVEARSP